MSRRRRPGRESVLLDFGDFGIGYGINSEQITIDKGIADVGPHPILEKILCLNFHRFVILLVLIHLMIGNFSTNQKSNEQHNSYD